MSKEKEEIRLRLIPVCGWCQGNEVLNWRHKDGHTVRLPCFVCCTDDNLKRGGTVVQDCPMCAGRGKVEVIETKL